MPGERKRGADQMKAGGARHSGQWSYPIMKIPNRCDFRSKINPVPTSTPNGANFDRKPHRFVTGYLGPLGTDRWNYSQKRYLIKHAPLHVGPEGRVAPEERGAPGGSCRAGGSSAFAKRLYSVLGLPRPPRHWLTGVPAS